MKLLAVLFLVGFALASAIPAPSHELSLDEADDLDLLLDFALKAEGDDDIKTELGKKLKEKFNEILEKVKDAIENGKVVKEDLLDKLKEIRNKLKDMKIDVGDKAKELLAKLKEAAKDYWKKILDKLTNGGPARLEERFILDGFLEKRLNRLLDGALEVVKISLDTGKNVTDHSLNTVKELIKKLKMIGMDVGDKVREFFEKHAKDPNILEDLLERLGLIKRETDFAEEEGDDEIKTELGKKLKEKFDEILEKVKDAIENGKVVKEDLLIKLKETREQLKELKVDIGNKARAILENLKEKAKDYWKKILDRLTGGGSARLAERNVFEEMKERLNAALDKLMEKVKESMEKGKDISEDLLKRIKDHISKLKAFGLDMSEKVRESLTKMIGDKGLLKTILGKLGIGESTIVFAEEEPQTDLGKRLKKELEDLLEKMKDSLDKGKELKETTLEKIKEIRAQLKDLKVDIGNKAKDLLEKVKDKVKDYWQKILDKLRPDSRRSVHEFAEEDVTTELGKKLKEQFDSILQKIKEALENGREVKEDTLEKLKEIRGKLKDLKLDLGTKAKELIEKIKEKGKDYWQKILDKLRPDTRRSVHEFPEGEDEEPKTELGKTLKKHLEELLEKIKDAIEHGKTVKEDYLEKAKQIREKLNELKEGIGAHAKDLLGKIKEKGKDYIKSLLEKLGLGKRALEAEEEVKEEIAKTLKEHLDELLEKIKDAVEHGKNVKDQYLVKVKEIRQKLKEMGKDIGEKAKDLLRDITEKGKDYFKKLLERLGLSKRSIAMYTEELAADDDSDDLAKLREKIGVFLKRVTEAIENDDEELHVEEISRQIVEQYMKLKNRGIELSEKDHDLIRLMGKKIQEFFKKKLENIGKQKSSTGGFKDKLRELRDKIKEKFDVAAIKEKIVKFFGNESEIGKFLIKLVESKGENAKQRILDFIGKFLGDEEDKRSIKDVYEKVKEYLKNIKIELKEKFSKFGEWAVGQYEKGLEKGKDRAETLKKLAKEFINKAKDMSHDVIVEAKDFFKEYKDDLGTVYDDVVSKIKEMIKS